MLLTNKEVGAMEEELEARYLLLEEEAAAYTETEYEEAIEYVNMFGLCLGLWLLLVMLLLYSMSSGA
mgnify:CR=1 FL=1